MDNALIIYSPGVWTRYGHAIDYVQGLGNALARKGVEVHVLGWDGPLSLSEHICEHRVSPHTFGFAKTKYRRLGPLGSVLWGLLRVRRERRLLGALGCLREELGFPPVLFETFEYIALAQFLKHNRSLSGQYSCIFHETNFNLRHPSFVTAAYKRAVRAHAKGILTNAHVAYVHGSEMRNNLLQNLAVGEQSAKRVQVLPYGSPHPETVRVVKAKEARARLGLPEGERVLLAFGTLRRDKQFEFIIQGVAEAANWWLVIAGPEGDYTYEDLERMIEKHRIQDRVTVLRKFIPPEEHSLYFGAADVVVNVYDRSIRHESGTAHQARAYLKPIIVDGPPDLVQYVREEEVGWWVDSSRPATLSKLLGEISMLSEQEWTALHDRIYQCACQRSWDSVARIVIGGVPGLATATAANNARNARDINVH